MYNSDKSDGPATGLPRVLLRLEGLGVLVLATAYYEYLNQSWLLFALFFFVPDIFMLGYLAGGRVGALIYNVGHTYVLPLVLLAVGWGMNFPIVVNVGIIWIAHIGLDRAIGYGLKYPSGFKHTHLNWRA